MLLPNEIRVYTGFSFSYKHESRGLVEEIQDVVDLTFESLRDKLADFSASSIDSGKLWAAQARNLALGNRVDKSLLSNLSRLGQMLIKEKKLDSRTIHALIGKYVYIRYLYDRRILSPEWLEEVDINLDSVLGRTATFQGLLNLITVLEARFEGNVFPFPPDTKLTDDVVSLVASAFKGDDPVSGQLHFDSEEFKAYDFSYIPIETLSSIYEQFLHDQGEGLQSGAVYTPEPVADYLLCEMDWVKPLKNGMKILDPCCGSGIFLVLAYRRLIEMELARSSTGKLRPTQLRAILEESIYGVERDQDACYVTEFSLLLTLMNYVEPPELHRNKKFRFPKLHNRRIFECDFFEDESEFWSQKKQFDWIVGNPPWVDLDENREIDQPALNWIQENAKHKPVASNRVCEAVSWRVDDLRAVDGYIGLLVHAKSLNNNSSEKYRQAFFKYYKVVRVTNFSSLRKVLFDGRAKAPPASLIYTKAAQDEVKPSILHYGPFVINQMSVQPWGTPKQKGGWTITVNENEIQTISPDEAEWGDGLTWKIALWGTYRDKKAIRNIQRLLPTTLSAIAEERDWMLCEGIQLRNRTKVNENTIKPISLPSGTRRFDVKLLKNLKNRFVVPDEALELVPEEEYFVRKRGGTGGLGLLNSPHMVLNSRYAIYSDEPFVIPSGQIGLAAPQDDSNYLRAVSVLRNSSLIQYYLFFKSPQLGIDRGRITLNAFEELPMPLFTFNQVQELANLHRIVSQVEADSQPERVQSILDQSIEQILQIPHHLCVLANDFIKVRISINEGVSLGIAVNRPTRSDLLQYGETLREELDEFTDGSGVRHHIFLSYSTSLIICTIEAVRAEQTIEVDVEESDNESSALFAHIRQKLKQQFSQWVYIQRGMRIFDNSRIHICKTPRLIDWTRTQAMQDSDDIIAAVLTARENEFKVAM